jgi:hypothetical protein
MHKTAPPHPLHFLIAQGQPSVSPDFSGSNLEFRLEIIFVNSFRITSEHRMFS